MQEDTPAWPQPMWGLFRLGRTGPVRSGHGRKGGTAWISAPGKTWAANRNHAAMAMPNSASPPPSHTERLRNPTSSPATIRNDQCSCDGHPEQCLRSAPLPAAPRRLLVSQARDSTLHSTRRCRGSSLRECGQRSRSHLRGRTVVESRSSPAPWPRDTRNKSLNANACTPSFLRKQEPETLWTEVLACAGTTGRINTQVTDL